MSQNASSRFESQGASELANDASSRLKSPPFQDRGDLNEKSGYSENQKPSENVAPRGYHLFQNGPIKLLSGALNAEIPRRPGSRNSRTTLVTPDFTPKTEINARISMAPSSLLASRVTDYRKWVLAVREPPEEEDMQFDEEFASAAALLREETPGFEDLRVKSTLGGPPLEDQMTLDNLKQIMKAFAAVKVDFFAAATPAVEDESEARSARLTSLGAVSTSTDEGVRFPGAPETKYDRKLTTEEFVVAVQRIIPTATRESIVDLVNKVDYEGVGAITWNELSTFLVSQTSHRTFLSKAGAEFTHTPEPLTCFMDNMHHLVSCYCTDESRRLIITGGQEGTVRAWTMTTLSYRGILFSTDSWITGVHFSATGRLLFVTTMDREIFLLDGSSFEVLRIYRGRPVEDNNNSLVYAHDTTRTVSVGGVPLPTRRALERQLADAAKLNEKRKQELATETITSASACEALNFDSMPLTGHGNGPYVERLMEECVLAGLVDPVTCSTYNHSHLEEEVVLLGTNKGDIYFYVLHARSNKKVLLSNHILRVHEARVNKMSFMYSMNALVSCADDGKVVVTSMVNGQPIRTFVSTQHHRHVAVRDFSIHPYYKMIVTTGPERYGLVWEFSQESPVAVLEAHNSPCRCCTFSLKHSQVVTVGVDGSIFVFDMNGFHLSQKLEPGFAYSPMIISCAASGSLLCLRRYPYHLRMKRQKTSMYNEKYRGHTASMVNILYTRTFDQIVTVDMEFTVMTWARQTGTNLFTFLLNGYSDSSTLNASHLTCASLDVAQRRLITGYQNGVVVVWNVVNGQAINFITAGMEEPDTVLSARSKTPGSPKSAGKLGTGGAGAGSLNTNSHRPVRTVGSLVRHGSTFFLFSIDDTLYIVRESSNYTVATASSWKVPTAYGEVTSIIQVTPQVIACGTSLGALFFFHVLSEKQDGAVRWLPDPNSALVGLVDMTGTMPSDGRLPMKRQTMSSISLAAHQLMPNLSASPKGASKEGHYLARVTQMFPLPAISANIFMTVHADGTVAFWHTFRRVFLGCLNLLSAIADEGKDRSGNLVVAVDDVHNLIVFGDEGGNVHVCEFHMELLKSEKEEAAALALGNPLMYFPLAQEETHHSGLSASNVTRVSISGEATGISNDDTGVDRSLREEHDSTEDPANEDTGPTVNVKDQPQPPRRKDEKTNTHSKYFMERAIYVVDKFERVNVFGTNIRSINGLILAHSPMKLVKKDTLQQSKESEPEVDEEPVIVCTGADSYSRCFTIRGEPIGELGMESWTLGDSSSYTYMGEPHAEFLPTSFTLEKGWSFNYLAEYLLSARQLSFSNTRKSRVRSQHSGSNINFLDMGNNRTFSKMPSLNNDSPAKETTHLVSTLYNMTNESDVPPTGSTNAGGEGTSGPNADEAANNTSTNNNISQDMKQAEGTSALLPALAVGFRHHPGREIDTKIHRSLRQRILVDVEPFKGVLQRRFLKDIHPPNQVRDDYRETPSPPSPPPNMMTPAEAQFLGIIENVFSDTNQRRSGIAGESGSLTIPGSGNGIRVIESVGLDDVIATVQGRLPSRSGVLPSPRPDQFSASSQQRRLSAVSLSLPGEDTPEAKPKTTGLMTQSSSTDQPKTSALPAPSFRDDLENDMSEHTFSRRIPTVHMGSENEPNTLYACASIPTTGLSGTDIGSEPAPHPLVPTFQDLPVSNSRSASRFRETLRQAAGSQVTSPKVARKERSQRPKYIIQPEPVKKVEKKDSSDSDEDDILDPNELIQFHLNEKKKQILESGCTDNSKRIIEHEMNMCGEGKGRRDGETLGGLATMGTFVDNVVEQHRKQRGPAALSGALSFIADISSRMHVAPIQEIEAPVGSKSRDEVQAWRDHLSRLQKTSGTKQRHTNAS